MEKNKLVKNVTVDELAMIINKGFDEQMGYLKKNFETINEKFEQVASKTQVQKLEKKVDAIDERLKRVETTLTEAHVL